jgi:hypothetical protein
MVDANWGAEEAPSKRSRIPKWLWWCGGGCLVALVLAVAAGFWLFKLGKQLVEEGRDPEQQWPKLQRVLPFEERPAGYQLTWGSTLLLETYALLDPEGRIGIVMRFRESQAASVEAQMMNPDYSGALLGMGGRKDLSTLKVVVQGRELEALRFYQEQGQDMDGDGRPDQGHTIVVRLTDEDAVAPVVLQLFTPGEGGLVPPTEDDVRAFLAPFHVGN